MADSRNDAPEITPQVVHLIDLLKRAKEGRLRVPRFQREFIWRNQDIVDLFDSIAKQYPIGTLFLWGARPVPNSRPHIGPLRLPDYEGETWLVLDGQQRLTALVGVLLAGESQWSADDDDDPSRWRLFFDAETGAFTHARSGEAPPRHYFPVPALLDTVKLFALIGEMLQPAPSASPPNAPDRDTVFRWIEKAQDVARAIQGYRIPLVEIKTNNLSIAVESFSRLNKKGRKIGQDEMFSALTYGEEGPEPFHLATRIDELQQEMVRSGFGGVDRTILLRAVLTAAGLDIYRTDWTQLGDRLKKDLRGQLPKAVDEAARGLAMAREFLRDVGVLNARMLPYSMQLVALSAFYGRNRSPAEAQTALLRRWFWSSSFAGWFGSGNPARVRRLVDELRDEVTKNPTPKTLEYMNIDQPALPTPLRFDLRSARVRTMLCVLLARNPRRPDGSEFGPEQAAQWLFDRGPDAMRTLCATVDNADLGRSPANRILDVDPTLKGRAQAKTWVVKLAAPVREQVLLSHAIEPQSFMLLENGHNDAFLQQRMKYISHIEREFMTQVQVTPPETDAPALSPLDADE